MAQKTETPVEGDDGYGNGYLPPTGAEGEAIMLELTVAEAQALRGWLLKPLSDGTTALDDEQVKSAMVKLASQLDFVEAVAVLRDELEQAGLPTTTLSDTEVAELGRRISQTAGQKLR